MNAFFCVKIKYDISVPLELLDELFREHLKIIERISPIHFDLIQIGSHQTKVFCSFNTVFSETIDSDKKLKDRMKIEIQGLIMEASYRVFSLVEPEIKTPIVLQWELI